MTQHHALVGGVSIHYLDHPGGSPPLVFLPGLSATAPIFEDLIGEGLSPRFRALALDLRGRGHSDAPPAGSDPARPAGHYTMADHAGDVVGLLDGLGLEHVVLVGHSFGGMLAFHLAAHHPARFPRLIVLDAAMAIATPATRELLGPMLARLGAVAPSWDAYLAALQKLPYLKDRWEPGIERYFRSYVRMNPDGSVRQLVHPEAILASVEAILAEDWPAILGSIRQPVLLINATEPYGPPEAAPFLPPDQALATVAALADGHYVAVPGNHITMVFGRNASAAAGAIATFAAEDTRSSA
jgi:pimeloyl-ACP methyl ester carboxylesterase